MKTRPALLCAALAAAAAPAPAQPAADDARAVIAAVLAHQASVRGPEGAAQTCVVGALAAPPAADGDDPMMPNQAVRIGFQWHAPEPPARVRPVRAPPEPGDPRAERRRQRERERMEPVPLPPALPQALADQLNALRTAAGSAPVSALRTIDAALVPAPLRLLGPSGDCAPLTLSAPVFAADAAFVETAYACGTVCGNGSFYALQRLEGRWEVVGIADIWIR